MKWRVTWFAWLAAAFPLAAQLVLVKPYVQPGPDGAVRGKDSALIVWLTDRTEAVWEVDYGVSTGFGRATVPVRSDLEPVQAAFKYVATLHHLPLDSRIHYRVRSGGQIVRQGSFAARKSATNEIHFIAVGDTADGGEGEKSIAWRMWQRRPDFLVHLGDIVYASGTVPEYAARFWNGYNNTTAPSFVNGAPLMQTVPFYVTIGNHDVQGTNMVSVPDGLGAFYYFHAPTNGPGLLASMPPLDGSIDQVVAFRTAAGPAYPGLCFYSFDNGPAHFLCLDGNSYVDVNEPALRQWIEADLTESRAPWKFVVAHQPPFQSSTNHYDSQQLRLLAPVFERAGVDVVFSGHVHNYQRSKPLRFAPAPESNRGGGDGRRVDGRFTVDESFDGAKNQRPNGVIYLVSGGGGAKLYDRGATSVPYLKQSPANWVPFTARFIADRHSFSEITVTPQRFTLLQVDADGIVIDRVQINKAP